MKKTVRIILCLLLVFVCILSLSACHKKKNNESEPGAWDDPIVLENCAIEHETKFGGVYIKITIDDFNAMGFAFGDSVDVIFSNGFKVEDIPYFNGFYVDMLEPLLVGYPGYPYIRVGYNNGEDMWNTGDLQATDSTRPTLWSVADVTAHDTATVIQKQAGKYILEQEAMDIHYTDTQDGRTDAVFANFRAVNTVAKMKQNTLYRSCSPIDNQHNRAHICDDLIEAAGVEFIMDLADSEDELAELFAVDDFDSPYFKSLADDDNVVALSMSSAYTKQPFSTKLVEGFRAIIASGKSKILVHCVEGKDRTGFVCVVIEALCGATYEEIVNDYMLTYDNYYGINKTSDESKYTIIMQKNLYPMLRYITGNDPNVDITSVDYEQYTNDFLRSIGLYQYQINQLKDIFKIQD